MYLDRYPHVDPGRCVVIPNGYDEADFTGIEIAPPRDKSNGRPLRLVHAGLIYTDDRDPRAFFLALSRLKRDGIVGRDSVVFDLRASGSENYYAAVLKELCIDDTVRLLPAVSHRQALEDCARADGLLLFQAASCNHQIPAKAYEYLRLGKPVLALTPIEGDTAKLFLEIGGATIVDLACMEDIYKALPRFVSLLGNGHHDLPNPKRASRYSRKYQTSQLSDCLSRVVSRE